MIEDGEPIPCAGLVRSIDEIELSLIVDAETADRELTVAEKEFADFVDNHDTSEMIDSGELKEVE